MLARGYEFYLLVFNSISRVEHKKIKKWKKKNNKKRA